MSHFDLENLAAIAVFAEASSIWKPADVTQEPHVLLHCWQVYVVKGGTPAVPGDTVHFTGYTGREGRVSSPVLQYDAKTHRGVTASGRIYELNGSPGYHSDVQYVWNRWLGIMSHPDAENVSDQYA